MAKQSTPLRQLPSKGSRAITTLALGDSHPLWNVSHPSIEGYARRTGADFVPILGPPLEREALLNTKIQEIYRLLGTYERLVFVDGDMIIHPECPDLFQRVPETSVGATDEGRTDLLLTSRTMREKVLFNACRHYRVDLEFDDAKSLGKSDSYIFFNSGLMVLSRHHRNMFIPRSTVKRIGPWVDMPFVNAMRMATGHPFCDLGFRFNYIGSLAYHRDRPFDPNEAWVVHASGGLSAIEQKTSGKKLSRDEAMALRCRFLENVWNHWNQSQLTDNKPDDRQSRT